MSPDKFPAGRAPAPGGPGATRSRVIAFAIVCVVCAALSGGYAWVFASRASRLLGPESLPPAAAVTTSGETPGAGERGTAPNRPQPATTDQPPENEHLLAPTEPPAASGQPPTTTDGRPATANLRPTSDDQSEAPQPMPAARTPPGSSLLVRHTGLDQSFGLLAVVSGDQASDRRASALHCDRVYFAVERGVCLTTDRAYTSRLIIIFDPQFRILFRLPLAGIPSRVRLSPNGRLAATTSFVAGHSYGDDIFATETNIIDTYTGERRIASLQDIEITRNGSRFQEIDFNVWGVSFAPDSDRFYATLGTGGKALLVEGSVAAQRMKVVYEGVECPSLSPDSRRIVYKKRLTRDGIAVWQLTALALPSMTETPLAETRSIDDQVEWLDADTVLYSVPHEPGSPVTDLWRARADGSGSPILYLRNAASPSVQHGE